LHTWSLGVEEQFYLLFPLFVAGLWVIGKRRLTAVLGVCLAVSLVLCIWVTYTRPSAAFYLSPFRAWELLTGALIAVPGVAAPSGRSPLKEAGAALGLSLVFASVFILDDRSAFPGAWALLPTGGTALVIYYGSRETAVGKVLGNKVLVSIGLISYSLYLWHLPIFATARRLSVNDLRVLQYWLLIGVAFLCAYLSWRLVERPFRNRSFLSRKQVFALSGVATALVLAMGLGTQRWSLLNLYDQGRTAEALARSAAKEPDIYTCLSRSDPPDGACVHGAGVQPTWAIWGDSHAAIYAHSLGKIWASAGYAGRELTKAACPPIRGIDGPDNCLKHNEKIGVI
jgi:hypothetical protein